MARTHLAYPPKFRAEAVRLVRETGKTRAAVARDLGVSAETVRVCVRQEAIDHGENEGLDGSGAGGVAAAAAEETHSSRRTGDPEKSRGLLRIGDRPEPAVMFRFVAREKANNPIVRLCRLLGVSPSGYYFWQRRGPSARSEANAELTACIREIHASSHGTYGAPRVHAELILGQGVRCTRKRVARLMHAAGLVGIHRRRRPKGTTRRDPRRPVFPDRVQRAFLPGATNRLWVVDITQHPTG